MIEPPRTRRGPAEAAALRALPPYPFATLERRAEERRRTGRPLYALHLGDPDLPPPAPVLDAARAAVADLANDRYSTSRGEPELRTAIAAWMHRRFGVAVDPETEVAVLLGSKEGLAGLPRALVDPGETVAVPDPGYPAYRAAVALAGARVAPLPLDPAAGWRPRWDAGPSDPRLVYLNYPNNPTGAAAEVGVLREAVDRARDGGWTVAYDNAYSEVTFGPRPAPSLLQVDGAREVGIEFHSLSKTFGIPGWRIGFAVGAAPAIAALVKLKAQADSGATLPMQRAAVAALELYRGPERPPEVERSVQEYGQRLRVLVDALGPSATMPGGGLYLWQRVAGSGSEHADRLLAEHGILVTPGAAFGPAGEPYVRWAVTRPRAEIDAVAAVVRESRATPV